LVREAAEDATVVNRTDEAGCGSFCSVSDNANRRAMISALCDLLALGSPANTFANIAHSSSVAAPDIKKMVIM
jgi:hypothetical protein